MPIWRVGLKVEQDWWYEVEAEDRDSAVDAAAERWGWGEEPDPEDKGEMVWHLLSDEPEELDG